MSGVANILRNGDSGTNTTTLCNPNRLLYYRVGLGAFVIVTPTDAFADLTSLLLVYID